MGHCIHGLGLGGAQQVIKHLCSGSSARFEHFVYSPIDGPFHDELAESGAKIRLIPRRIPKFDPFWIQALAARMRSDRIQVVHAHLFGDSLHAHFAARLARHLPVIVTLHNVVDEFTKPQMLAYRWLLPRAARVVACGHGAHASFQSFLGSSVPLDLIPNGIPENAAERPPQASLCALRSELGITAEDFVIGTSGRMVEQKGYEYLLAAVSKLRTMTKVPIRLILLGEGALLSSLRREASRLHIDDRTLFLGYRGDARRVLWLFDVFALSSVYEGLPIALLEAMAARRCIVATSAPGLREVLRADDDALLVPVRDSLALANALHRVVADRDLCRALGEAAHQRFRSEFTAGHMIERYERAYAEIVDRPIPTPVITGGVS